MERTYKCRTHPFTKGARFVGMIILGAMAAVGFAILFGYFVMLLWNWLMPLIFGLTTITFWQAVGIVVLARLIFGGFKHGSPPHHNKSEFHKKKFFNHWADKSRKDRKFKDWKYFDEYWWDEGEKAYNDYTERRKEQDQR